MRTLGTRDALAAITAAGAYLHDHTPPEIGEPKARRAQSRPDAVTVLDAAELLGCGRSKVFDLLRAGALARLPGPGRATWIARASIDAYMDRMGGSNPSRPTPTKRRTRPTSRPAGNPVPSPEEMTEALRASRRALLKAD